MFPKERGGGGGGFYLSFGIKMSKNEMGVFFCFSLDEMDDLDDT